MMRTIIFSAVVLLLISCQPEDAIPETPVTNDMFDKSKAVLLKQGMLEGIGHTVMGTTSVYEFNGKYVVLLDPYESQNGPDLKVYLSKDEGATEYIRLGQLKSVTGSQSYDVPGNPNIEDYAYVHIWCEKYSVVFGRASVK
jgi:hypothetical protein